MKRIATKDNLADVMTKQTGRQLFYHHFDYILGRVIQDYVKHLGSKQKSLMHQAAYVKIILAENQFIRYSTPTPYCTGDFNTLYSKFCSNDHGGDITPSTIRGDK